MSDSRPRIAIPVPTLAETEYNARSWPLYAAAVASAGGTPVELPLSLAPAAIARIVTGCQGILLPGSPADVNPAKYEADRWEQTAPPDVARENMDELLLQDAYNLHRPLLAICYGAQSLNTWRSGTLAQDLTPLPVNHAAGRSVAVAHTVHIEPASLLAEIVQPSPEVVHRAESMRLPVNSSHHQAVERVGDGLRAVACCPQDGVIEAIEGQNPEHFVLGLQWHPERSVEISPASRLIFQRFIAVCAEWRPRPVRASLG